MLVYKWSKTEHPNEGETVWLGDGFGSHMGSIFIKCGAQSEPYGSVSYSLVASMEGEPSRRTAGEEPWISLYENRGLVSHKSNTCYIFTPRPNLAIQDYWLEPRILA